jgi:hypothetical protein
MWQCPSYCITGAALHETTCTALATVAVSTHVDVHAPFCSPKCGCCLAPFVFVAAFSTENCTPHVHTAYLTRLTSRCTPHTPYLAPRTLHLAPRTAQITPHISHPIPHIHTAYRTRHMHAADLTRHMHTSYLTLQTCFSLLTLLAADCCLQRFMQRLTVGTRRIPIYATVTRIAGREAPSSHQRSIVRC